MRWLKPILSLLCLAVWLLATQHCNLENLPGLAFLHCSEQTPATSDCGSCNSCATVEGGVYKCPDNGKLIVVPALAKILPSLVAAAPEIPAQAKVPSLQSFHREPPRECWQCYSVLATPVRGPSFPA